jgi:hypothetical protein
LVTGRSFFDAAPGARVGDARLGAFRDAVLELGSVPLPIVTAWIDGFITEDGKGHYRDME